MPPQKTVPWWTCRGETLITWTKVQTLQGLSQSLTERVWYKPQNLGDPGARPVRLVRQNQQRHYLLWTKQVCGGTTEAWDTKVQSCFLATYPDRPPISSLWQGIPCPYWFIQSHEAPHLTVLWLSWSSSTTTDEQHSQLWKFKQSNVGKWKATEQ